MEKREQLGGRSHDCSRPRHVIVPGVAELKRGLLETEEGIQLFTDEGQVLEIEG